MTDNAKPDSLPPCHADLRDLHERIQKVGEMGMALDQTIKTQCSNLHSIMLATLRDIELNLGFMWRKKLITVVAEFTTVLNKVEENYRNWAKYDRTMTLYRASDVHDSIVYHGLCFLCIVAFVQELNLTDDHVPDPRSASPLNQDIQEVVRTALRHFEKLDKELIATPRLASSADFSDNPNEPGAQIIGLELFSELDVGPSAEFDAKVEKNSYFIEPMFEGESSCISKMVLGNRCYVAAKAPKAKPKDGLTPLLKQNASVWGSMDHPNILPLLAVCAFPEDVEPRVHFISPWVKNGNVRFYLSSNPGADRVKLIHDVALGLQYLHSIGVVHRNLKGSNVLVNLDGTAMISGFSVSEILGPDNKSSMSRSIEGDDLRWAPPNHENSWGKEGDIWSWSMTAIEILSGELPFKQINSWDVQASLQVRVEGVRPTREEYLPRHIASSQVWDLLNRCWKVNPEERINIDEVVADLDSERRATGWDPLAPTLRRDDWEDPAYW